MNKFILLLIETVLCVNIYAQNNEKTIEELEAEAARLNSCVLFHSTHKDVIINSKTGRDQAITEIDCKANFKKYCQEYDKAIVELDRLNAKKYPNTVPSNHLIYSTDRQINKTEINMYYESVSKPIQFKPLIRGDAVDAKRKISEYEAQLEKIRNTKKLYQDLANTLQHEMKYNLVEMADNAGDLLLKHVSVPEGDVLKAKAMEELRKNAGVENEKPIKNELANIVNSIIDGSEKIIELVPEGDKLTNHYLWKLFKSTPEAGKGLGHFAASVNIYFRKNEHENKIKDLSSVEQQLINAIEIQKKIAGE